MDNIFDLFEVKKEFTLLGVGYLDEVARHPVTDILDITTAQLHEYITECAITAQIKKDIALSTYNIDLLNEAEQGFFDFFKKVGEAIKLFFNKIWVNIVSIFKSRVEYVKKYEEQIKSGYNDEKTAVITTIEPKELEKFKITIESVNIDVTNGVISVKLPNDINGYTPKDSTGKQVASIILKFEEQAQVESHMKIIKEVNNAISEYYQGLDWEAFDLNLSLDDITTAMNSIKSQPKFIADVDKSIKVYSNMAKLGEKYAKEAEKTVIGESKKLNNFDYMLLEIDGDAALADAKAKEDALKTQETEVKQGLTDNGLKSGEKKGDKVDETTPEGKSQINKNKYKIVRYLQTMVNLQSMVLKRQVDVLKKSNDKYWELIRAAHKEYLNKKSKNEVE